MHAYLGVRLLPGLSMPGTALGVAALAALFGLLLLGVNPALARGRLAGALEWAGLTAIGFFSTLLVLTVLRDVMLLAWTAISSLRVMPPPSGSFTSASALAVPALAFAATAFGLFNARRRPQVREVTVPIANLPPAFEGFSIVQISDLHVGPTIGKHFVESVVETANRLAPDVIVVTGDVVDGRVAKLAEHVAPLGELLARHGVFAVTGNHEYYSGASEWIAEFERLRMTVLMNRHVALAQGDAKLILAGVADYSAHHFDPGHRSDPAKALQGASANAGPKVLLAHQPRSAQAAAAAGFDLQLSGHTHGGQFWPWNLFVPLQQPYTAGLHRHGAMWVYTSRGTGYLGAAHAARRALREHLAADRASSGVNLPSSERRIEGERFSCESLDGGADVCRTGVPRLPCHPD